MYDSKLSLSAHLVIATMGGLLIIVVALAGKRVAEERSPERVPIARAAAAQHLRALFGRPPESLVCQENPHLWPTERCDALVGGRVVRLLCERGSCTLMGNPE
jgi:hypothetical protein